MAGANRIGLSPLPVRPKKRKLHQKDINSSREGAITTRSSETTAVGTDHESQHPYEEPTHADFLLLDDTPRFDVSEVSFDGRVVDSCEPESGEPEMLSKSVNPQNVLEPVKELMSILLGTTSSKSLSTNDLDQSGQGHVQKVPNTSSEKRKESLLYSRRSKKTPDGFGVLNSDFSCPPFSTQELENAANDMEILENMEECPTRQEEEPVSLRGSTVRLQQQQVCVPTSQVGDGGRKTRSGQPTRALNKGTSKGPAVGFGILNANFSCPPYSTQEIEAAAQGVEILDNEDECPISQEEEPAVVSLRTSGVRHQQQQVYEHPSSQVNVGRRKKIKDWTAYDRPR